MQRSVRNFLQMTRQPPTPPLFPCVALFLLLKLVPSHDSPRSMVPLPDMVQPLVSKAVQSPLHLRVPVAKPSLEQLLPFRLVPSQISGLSTVALPQVARRCCLAGERFPQAAKQHAARTINEARRV